ncbi:unnamed protein product [Vicia faba]|uniref:Uncharacterized protein n=1 Tax=Vicia faba TaxID=3906 RepID=A0AAV0YEL9_VICFA|nr:unnamed protein product [Vicia faba]
MMEALEKTGRKYRLIGQGVSEVELATSDGSVVNVAMIVDPSSNQIIPTAHDRVLTIFMVTGAIENGCLELRDDNTLLDNCSKYEYSAGAEDQDKHCSTAEHGLNPDGCLIHPSDDSPGYEEKQSFVSLYNI